ncbi:MAG: DUF1835 domain-containing protein [Steroidobacteraceae bacterium]
MADPTGRAPSAFRLNLEQQKKRAKDLLRAAHAGEAEALARIAATHRPSGPVKPDEVHTSAPHSAPLKLADAQFAIARELRFTSWAKLKSHIELMDREWTDIERNPHAPDGDMKTLHIRCGHDIQNTLAQAGFVGDFHAHITPYCQGPVTNGPERHELMARFIIDAYAEFIRKDRALEYEAVLEGERREDDQLLTTAFDYERIVIWMEHDSWDQLILIRLLAHYADAQRPRQLELIAINEFPGGERFLGVGQLPPEALRLLWPSRMPITPAQLALGRQAWHALTSPDPRTLAAIARSGTPALPMLAPALHRHLRELPCVENGLSLSQQLILQTLVEHETLKLNDLHWILTFERDPLPFLTDAGLEHVVKQMEHAAEPPLLRTLTTPGERSFNDTLTITDAGRAVISGVRDWHSLKPAPRWVGGVQIMPGRPGWRWNESTREPVRVA